MPTMFGLDHMNVKRCDTQAHTPKSLKRERSSPTGSTPHQPSKIVIAFEIIIAFSVQSKKLVKISTYFYMYNKIKTSSLPIIQG
ncbi:hypothetical protein DPMN_044837 [Dreissena polymorpha]|uniref:Uncharacterized protein n=1 Tax=Dreissena polymorpha TaxID=45954 RepID=A0A9D4D4V6_DREPO|nr:hypothetical protein DPMN_044837 [Dreissena polymorpha]